MASFHAKYVDEYLEQRRKVEDMRKQEKLERLERKQFKKQDDEMKKKQEKLDSLEREKIKKHENKMKKKLDMKRKEKLLSTEQLQVKEAKAKMMQFNKKSPPQDDRVTEMVEKVFEEDFTIGEPYPNFSVFQSVFYSHNFFRSRVLCLMCLRSKEKKYVFLKIPDGNSRGIVGHMDSKQKQYAKMHFLLKQNIQRLRTETRLERPKNLRTIPLGHVLRTSV